MFNTVWGSVITGFPATDMGHNGLQLYPHVLPKPVFLVVWGNQPSPNLLTSSVLFYFFPRSNFAACKHASKKHTLGLTFLLLVMCPADTNASMHRFTQ